MFYKGINMAKIRLVERITPKYESFSPKTVKIGDRTWMAENLAIDDGGNGIYLNGVNGEYYYSWYAARRIAKSIPGWHFPTDEEWVESALACGAHEDPRFPGYYVGAEPLKEKLNIKLAGHRRLGSFYSVGSGAFFWTATENSSSYAYYRFFSTGAPMVSNYDNKTIYAYTVRLIKD